MFLYEVHMLSKRWRGIILSLFAFTVMLFSYQAGQTGRFPTGSGKRVYHVLPNCSCIREVTPETFHNTSVEICSPYSSDRGHGQNVISYSIYGDHKNEKVLSYYRQIEDRIKEANYFYKGWIVRLYHNASVDDVYSNELICSLYCKYPDFDPCNITAIQVPSLWSNSLVKLKATSKLKSYLGNLKLQVPFGIVQADSLSEGKQNSSSHLDIIKELHRITPSQMTQSNISFGRLLEGKLWRFLPLADDNVNTFLIRDVDSLILPREVSAVEEWIQNSTALVHAMRDHPSHNGVMLAGMWGGARWRNKKNMTNLLRQIIKQTPRNLWNFDQILLHRIVWPNVIDNIMIHDSYHCVNPFLKPKTKVYPFPTRRRGRYFVSWGPFRNPKELQGIIPCPVQCRPPDHLEWEYC